MEASPSIAEPMDGTKPFLSKPPSMMHVQTSPPQGPMTVRPGNHERAWNDPPVFDYEVNAVGKPAPTKLNKRVAFPLTSTRGPSTSSTLMFPTSSEPLLPPLPSSGSVSSGANLNNSGGSGPIHHQSPPLITSNVEFIPTLPIQVGIESSGSGELDLAKDSNANLNQNPNDADSSTIITKLSSKDDVFGALQGFLNEIPSIESKTREEIKRRLDILESHWDGLNEEVQVRVKDLAESLGRGDFKTAESLQLNLGLDFMEQCGSWLMALKQLIRAKTQEQD